MINMATTAAHVEIAVSGSIRIVVSSAHLVRRPSSRTLSRNFGWKW
jgi:hypothetical protein